MSENNAVSILLVDDDLEILSMLADTLTEGGYKVRQFHNPVEAISSFQACTSDLVLTDLQMPGMGGIDLLRKVKAHDADVPVILLTAGGTIQNAVQAMKDGAFDFLTKPVDVLHLLEIVRRALEFKALKRENLELRTEVADLRNSRIAPVGTYPGMIKVMELAQAVATTDETVLITGESGVGKEVLAGLIQRKSRRKEGPYIKVNCAALTGTLLESELFGHERGAFTGASERHIGRFELAQKGTIFLDEIGEMNAEAQTRLLRVLQNRELQRVGGNQTIALDIRVLCATNRDLKAEVKAGNFREDLYYRVNVFPVQLPPLRERKADIPALALDLLKSIRSRVGRGPKEFSSEAIDKMVLYSWPGNIREMENVLARCAILCQKSTIEADDLPVELVAISGEAATGVSPSPKASTEGSSLDDARAATESAHIVEVLEQCRWRMADAAKLLGISRSTLYVKLDRYGIRR